MHRRTVGILSASCLLFICGCVSVKHSPGARFFVLRAVAEQTASRTGVSSRLIGTLPAELPDHLVRSQMVTWTSDSEVRLDEFNRWAEPLNVGVTRVVRENLAILLPEARFIEFPWRTADPVRCRVQVQVGFLGLQADGTVKLEGSWALLPPVDDEPLRMEPFESTSDRIERRDPERTVETMSRLLAALCEDIAAGIRSLPPDAGQSEGTGG